MSVSSSSSSNLSSSSSSPASKSLPKPSDSSGSCSCAKLGLTLTPAAEAASSSKLSSSKAFPSSSLTAATPSASETAKEAVITLPSEPSHEPHSTDIAATEVPEQRPSTALTFGVMADRSPSDRPRAPCDDVLQETSQSTFGLGVSASFISASSQHTRLQHPVAWRRFSMSPLRLTNSWTPSSRLAELGFLPAEATERVDDSTISTSFSRSC
mmetsp:Transcript_57710/g.153832  ORF Transcript_57710/g.153832 Transcript_57710/m.153832 type:complete len:212 (-) Transcript_57710:1248-1883(-)